MLDELAKEYGWSKWGNNLYVFQRGTCDLCLDLKTQEFYVSCNRCSWNMNIKGNITLSKAKTIIKTFGEKE